MSNELDLRVPITIPNDEINKLEDNNKLSDLTANESDKNEFEAALDPPTNPNDSSGVTDPPPDTVSGIITNSMKKDE
ncbi:MAG: hypothetical protein LBT86_10215 [Deltaproteobacteria bacterium]|jgi:hypothetical protein|nr:hypothetical protein [Deltaproteobacteria bacterium]